MIDLEDIQQMPIEERSSALVGDMPWITAKLDEATISDMRDQIKTCIEAAVVQERNRCVQRVQDVTSQVSYNRMTADWKWILNPQSGGPGSPCMQAKPK